MKHIISISLILFALNNTILLSQSKLDEAARQSLETLSQMAESDIIKDLNTRAIKNSDLGSGIEERLVNFDRFIKRGDNFKSISKSEDKFHYPVIARQNVISTISMNSEKLKAVNYNDQFITRELNSLPNTLRANGFQGVELYRIPNLNAYVYVDDNGMAYTSYNGRSLKEGRKVTAVFNDLKEEAILYNKKYGGLLKGKRLLH